METVTKKNALAACIRIRNRNGRRFMSFAKIQCWGCMKYSHGDEDLFCFNSTEHYRGCGLVNKEINKT